MWLFDDGVAWRERWMIDNAIADIISESISIARIEQNYDYLMMEWRRIAFFGGPFFRVSTETESN